MEYDSAEKDLELLVSTGKEPERLQDVVDYLYNRFDKYSWIGIYIVRGNELVLGPWRGAQPTEHTNIPIGKGICGSAAQTGKTEIVSDVSKDNRYLSCFVSTRSEIVVPIKKNETIIGEIDIDSDIPNAFDRKDADFLEKLASNKKFLRCVSNY